MFSTILGCAGYVPIVQTIVLNDNWNLSLIVCDSDRYKSGCIILSCSYFIGELDTEFQFITNTGIMWDVLNEDIARLDGVQYFTESLHILHSWSELQSQETRSDSVPIPFHGAQSFQSLLSLHPYGHQLNIIAVIKELASETDAVG